MYRSLEALHCLHLIFLFFFFTIPGYTLIIYQFSSDCVPLSYLGDMVVNLGYTHWANTKDPGIGVDDLCSE